MVVENESFTRMPIEPSSVSPKVIGQTLACRSMSSVISRALPKSITVMARVSSRILIPSGVRHSFLVATAATFFANFGSVTSTQTRRALRCSRDLGVTTECLRHRNRKCRRDHLHVQSEGSRPRERDRVSSWRGCSVEVSEIRWPKHHRNCTGAGRIR